MGYQHKGLVFVAEVNRYCVLNLVSAGQAAAAAADLDLKILTLFYLVDYAILINWKSPFVVLGVFFISILFRIENIVSKQCKL